MKTIIDQITLKTAEKILETIEKIGISRIGETIKTSQEVINIYV